jgi:hypothetical protein
MKKRVVKKAASKRQTMKKTGRGGSPATGLVDLLRELLKDVRLDLSSDAASLVSGKARSVQVGAARGTKPLPLLLPESQQFGQFGTTRGITFSPLTAAGVSDYEWLNIRRLQVVLVKVDDAAKHARKGPRAADETHAPQQAQLDGGPKFEWQPVFVNVFEKVPIA